MGDNTPPYMLTHCTVADGAALSRNNMSAFWQDASWRLSWRHRTLEQHIAEQAKRYPRSLLSDRATTRHIKAIDPATGALVGYCRWVLPASCVNAAAAAATMTTTTTAATSGGSAVAAHVDEKAAALLVWPEGVVPAVPADEEAEIQRVAAAAVFDPDTSSDALDRALQPIKKEILARKEYISAYCVNPKSRDGGRGRDREKERLSRGTRIL
jgi:hypothetical protein